MKLPTHRNPVLRRVVVAIAGAALVGSALAACTPSGEGGDAGEIVITCTVCQPSPEDATLQYEADVVDRFNQAFAGQYRIDVIETEHSASGNGDRLQNYQRLALAGDLPDIFEVNPTESASLADTGALLDFKPILDADPDWAGTFYPDAFGAHVGDDGQQWAIPNQRDSIGIFYNKKLFSDAGVEFPTTWDEMLDACAAIKASGKLCWAMDGDWVTQLLLADLVGTQDGGAEFLESGIKDRDYAGDERLAKSVEYIRELSQKGYVNDDAFSGDFESASQPFLRGDAAIIANGPWYISNLSLDPAIPGLADEVGYEPSPGWTADSRGITVLSGEGAWASGSTDPDKIEAVTAFVKFATSRDEAFKKIVETNSFTPVNIDFTDAEAAQLPALAVDLTKASADLPHVFRHVPYAAPAGFNAAWKNLWPSYVKGELSTDEFLTELGDDAAGTGN